MKICTMYIEILLECSFTVLCIHIHVRIHVHIDPCTCLVYVYKLKNRAPLFCSVASKTYVHYLVVIHFDVQCYFCTRPCEIFHYLRSGYNGNLH